MAQKQSAQEWARTAPLPHPPRWGEIETALLARAGRPPGFTVIQIVAIGIALTILTVSFGAAVIGLVVIMVADHPMGAATVRPLQFVYLFAVVTPLILLGPWRSDRQRGPVTLLVPAVSGAASLAAYLILRAEPDPGELGWIPLQLLLAIATGFGVFLVVLIASKPRRRRRLSLGIRLRTFLNPRNEMHYVQTRAEGLDVLLERSDIHLDEKAQDHALKLQLGEWHKLDTPEQS